MNERPDEQDEELTPDEVEGIQLGLDQIDRGEVIDLEDAKAQLHAELMALAEVRRRRAAG